MADDAIMFPLGIGLLYALSYLGRCWINYKKKELSQVPAGDKWAELSDFNSEHFNTVRFMQDYEAANPAFK